MCFMSIFYNEYRFRQYINRKGTQSVWSAPDVHVFLISLFEFVHLCIKPQIGIDQADFLNTYFWLALLKFYKGNTIKIRFV